MQIGIKQNNNITQRELLNSILAFIIEKSYWVELLEKLVIRGYFSWVDNSNLLAKRLEYPCKSYLTAKTVSIGIFMGCNNKVLPFEKLVDDRRPFSILKRPAILR